MVRVLVIMNDYFHDVASAMLLASAVIVYVLRARAATRGPRASADLEAAMPALARVAAASAVWVVVGAIPRLAFLRSIELARARDIGTVPALGVKYALMVVAVAAGAAMWARLLAARPAGDSAA